MVVWCDVGVKDGKTASCVNTCIEFCPFVGGGACQVSHHEWLRNRARAPFLVASTNSVPLSIMMYAFCSPEK